MKFDKRSSPKRHSFCLTWPLVASSTAFSRINQIHTTEWQHANDMLVHERDVSLVGTDACCMLVSWVMRAPVPTHGMYTFMRRRYDSKLHYVPGCTRATCQSVHMLYLARAGGQVNCSAGPRRTRCASCARRNGSDSTQLT